MNGPDELSKLLKRWEAPEPGARLDQRIWSVRGKPKASGYRKWLPIAAGIFVALGGAKFLSHSSEVKSSGMESRIEASGFRPMPNGAITVSGQGETR